MADIPGLVEYIARSLCDKPDEVEVSVDEGGRNRTVQLKVADADMGRMIGREGRVANAIRAVMQAAPKGEDDWHLEIVD